jgi:hypothetical protein
MISLETAADLLDFGGRIGTDVAREQLEGAVALHNILERQRFAYLADEVGMGKTYVALGVLALFRHFDPSFRVLVITPRANIQQKWHKELKNLVAHHVRFPDLRIKAVHGAPARPVVLCQNLIELVRETALDPDRDFLVRMSSFSFGLGDDTARWREKRKQLLEHLPWLEPGDFDLRRKEDFKDDYARAVCCALPSFDLVVVDEGHNLKHGFQPGVAFRNRLMALALGHPRGRRSDARFAGYGPRAKRVLLLSATPLEQDYRQLWHQLDVFGVGDSSAAITEDSVPDDQKRALVRDFLIRRVTGMRLAEQRWTKNMYRREWRNGGVAVHDAPLRIADTRQRLVVALVQKKVAELLPTAKFNNSFQIGMLASFESFLETAKVAKREDDEAPTNFDDVEQTDDPDERLGIDVGSVNKLARSYRSRFGRELPHPKMDAVVEELKEGLTSGRKALVFVRRIQSVAELRRRLELYYDDQLLQRLQRDLPAEVQDSLRQAIGRYRDEQQRRRIHAPEPPASASVDDELDVAPQEAAEEADRGGNETFFAWFFRGEGPREILSGALMQRRLGATGSTFFKDNHVAAVLGVEPGTVFRALLQYIGGAEEAIRTELAARAAARLPAGSRADRPQTFEAVQHAAFSLLVETGGHLREEIATVRRERYAEPGLTHPGRGPSLDPRPWLEERTFWTELRRRPGLRSRLWPASGLGDFRMRFREEELRRELLSAMARLGHPLLDLYVLAIKRIGSLSLRARETAPESAGDLASAYLDLLERQLTEPEGEVRGVHELELAARHFDLLLDVNLPDARDIRLNGAAREFGKLLRGQQPVAGMFGEINQTVVRQFRMPGYPFVLVTTDLLQEGEDLHTFCSSVHHYGISWTPSSMEQRVGRVDRVNSETERRLSVLSREPRGEELLQVYFPHLRDSVEVLQVERVLERMNRFVRIMHEDLRQPEGDDREVNVPREALRVRRDIEQIRGPLRTAFGIDQKWLHGERRPLAVSPGWAAALEKRLRSIPEKVRGRLEITWETSSPPYALLGTIRRRRVQPFTLVLRSIGGTPLLRCISPVGVLRCDQDPRRIARAVAKRPVRVCALLDEDKASYDLTVEDDVLLGEEPYDEDRVVALLSRVTSQADYLEEELLKKDQPMSEFREDLEEEGGE